MANFNKKNPKEEKVQLTNVQRLMDIINNRRDAGKQQPFGFPDNQQEFAQQFIKFLEPRMKYEIDELGKLPYQERLAECLVNYYRLSHHNQKYLHHLRENNVYWRGDSIEFMKAREKIDMNKIDKTKLKSMIKSIIARA